MKNFKLLINISLILMWKTSRHIFHAKYVKKDLLQLLFPPRIYSKLHRCMWELNIYACVYTMYISTRDHGRDRKIISIDVKRAGEKISCTLNFFFKYNILIIQKMMVGFCALKKSDFQYYTISIFKFMKNLIK